MLRILLFAAAVLGATVCHAQLRIWTKATGVFQLEAELIERQRGVVNGNVKLRKADGTILTVPTEAFCLDDQLRFLDLPRRYESEDSGFYYEPLSPPPDGVSTRSRVEKSLKLKVEMNFIKTPLADVVDYFADVYEFPILYDWQALDRIPVRIDFPVTIHRTASLQSCLATILREKGLAFVVSNDALLITSQAEAKTMLEPRVYRIIKPTDINFLIRDITTNVAPESWKKKDGLGLALTLDQKTLVILQTQTTHRTLMRHYGSFIRSAALPDAAVHDIAGFNAPVAALNSETTALPIPTLTDAAAILSKHHKIRIQFDFDALDAIGYSRSSPFYAQCKHMSLATMLNLVTDRRDWAWECRNGGVVITSRKETESPSHLLRVSYDLGALSKEELNPNSVMKLIQKTVLPTMWKGAGGFAEMKREDGRLIVKHSFQGHQHLARLWAQFPDAPPPENIPLVELFDSFPDSLDN